MPITYDRIQSTNISSQSSISFTNIPQTYTDLRIIIYGYWTSSGQVLGLRCNNDSTTNIYKIQTLNATASSSVSSGQTTANFARLNFLATNGTSTDFEFYTIDLFSYATTNTRKPFLLTGSQNRASTSNTSGIAVGMYDSSNAVTRLDVVNVTAGPTGTWGTGSIATIYGILRA